MNKFYYFVVMVFLLTGACASPDQGSEPNSQYLGCLADFDFQYDQILTKGDVQKHVEIDESSFKEELDTKNTTYGSVSYVWDSDRPATEMSMGGMTLPVPDRNQVLLKLLSFYEEADLDKYSQKNITALFNQGYKAISDEEFQNMKGNLEKRFQDSPEEYNQALGLLEARRKQNYNFEENLADRAYWRYHDDRGLEMAVLAGEANFTLHVKISADQDENLRVARGLVGEILSKCNH